MVKALLLLTTFFTSAALAQVTPSYYVAIFNNAGKSEELAVPRTKRYCVCLKNTQTARIMNYSGSDVKVFSSTDCTGNYAAVKDDIYNAQWVNSMSYGRSGISSEGPDTCPNYWN
ncbi:hypothetical protein BGX29_000748 [Mortierella sp. GBA35]|nr:hypothetical protein BGX23_000412 [Mortierella sp. AD031]KAF9087600.1 hypothetical protein BGX29_000748 [Mortierella sp. GBA35]KAG0199360.1 hypothetical protein BGX33_011708 [Mortierella sp. NVP41]